jgi:uncharacterized protein YchJ
MNCPCREIKADIGTISQSMVENKHGRNDPCPCGSGKKFKHCCLDKQSVSRRELSWDEKVNEAAMLSLEPDQAKVDLAVKQLDELLKAPALTPQQKNQGLLAYARALQSSGEHSLALDALDKVNLSAEPKHQSGLAVWLALQRASSFSALGKHDEACAAIAGHIDELKTLSNRERGMMLVEVGKVFSLAGKKEDARSFWEQGLQALEGNQSEIGHYAGLLANLASLKLKSGNEQSEAEGIQMMDKAMEMKTSIGDLYGLANSYDMLGHFYNRTHRFERAIANFRQGLALSRQIGDRHGLAQALINLGGLYILMRQVGQARQSMKEAKSLADKLNNQNLIQLCETNLQNVELNARDFGLNGEAVGSKAKCVCGSGKTYEECCGRADFEPVNLPWTFGGASFDAQQIYADLSAAGVKPTRLDLFLRAAPHLDQRNAWFKVMPQDGWHEVHELPDLASIHLRAAKEAADKAKHFPNTYESPLASLILSACVLEAFINQVIFFVVEVHRTDGIDVSKLPKELFSDCHLYQRANELTQKWDVMGKALCYAKWPPNPDLWADFKRLVAMRNEFVHFKLAEYEQIIPPPKRASKATGLLPPSVQPRQVHQSWAFKVLSSEMAEWAVKVTEQMLYEFRSAYAETRKLDSKPKTT